MFYVHNIGMVNFKMLSTISIDHKILNNLIAPLLTCTDSVRLVKFKNKTKCFKFRWQFGEPIRRADTSLYVMLSETVGVVSSERTRVD